MLLHLLLALLLPPVFLLLATARALFSNYSIARNVGLPIIIVPISPENPLWMILARFILPIINRLPFGSGYFSRFCHIGWEFDEKNRVHLELGDAFMLVSPGKNWIYLCNADAVNDVYQGERRHDYERPVELLAMLDVFGPNISTVHGQDWQRQRKCTAATFNESSNRLVWAESLRQAQQMLHYWTSAGEKGVRSTASDTRTLALDVLLGAGFGKSYAFQGATETDRTTGTLSYRDALALILENAILILALGPKLLSRLSFPRKLARLGEATVTFKQYMVDLFEEEKHAIAEGQNEGGNLMTSLVRAAVDDNQMSQDEVFGNMFVFNFAGHDTTAHSLAYTFVLLTAHPEVQEWMTEEIRHVLKDDDQSKWSYNVFPKMNRTLAVLLETLRLYDPILSVVKGTQQYSTSLTIGPQTITIPPMTRVILNLNGIHSHPRYWGDDALEWRPTRWILTTPGDGPAIDREYLITPPKGAYVPWSDGVRACPGRKFAQVEHVGVMAALFREHCVSPVKKSGEGDAAARERIMRVAENSGMMLLLQMLQPEQAVLKWEKRQVPF